MIPLYDLLIQIIHEIECAESTVLLKKKPVVSQKPSNKLWSV